MENTRSGMTLAEQNEILGQTLALQEVLAKILTEGKDTGALIDAFANSMKCCTVLEASGLVHVACCFNEDSNNEVQLRPFVSVKTSQSFNTMPSSTTQLKNPLHVTDQYTDFSIHRLISTVNTGSKRLAYLSVLRTDAPFSEAEITVFRHAVCFFAVQLAQDKKIAEMELRLKGNIVEDLISANYSDPESITSRARALDYDISQPHRVLVVKIDNIKHISHHLKQDQKAIQNFKMELVNTIQSHLDLTAKGIVAYNLDEIIMFVQQSSASSKIQATKQLAEEIIQNIATQFKSKLYIGIGSSCVELADFKQSYLAAKKSLEIGEFMITEGQVRSFEQFSVHALFLSTLKPAELYNYARGQLGALIDYDEIHKTELIKTLQEFLYLRNNLEATSKSINMSISGLKYRLQKIEHIIGQELKDYKVSFDLQLALVILQLFGDYRIKKP